MAWVFFEKLKDQSCDAKNKRYGEMDKSFFETYIISVMPHGKNVVNTSSDMDMATICAYK